MKPYYEESGITIYHGDCGDVCQQLPVELVDVVIADPPYGETSLVWDTWRRGWLDLASHCFKPNCSVWVFGSFRYFIERVEDFKGWNLAQEIVWEKQNGSSFHADRFKRVHELAVQFYQGEWADIYKQPVMTMDATARVTRRKTRPPHTGNIGAMAYVSHDGGPRLMRSIVKVRNCHGYAVHPTQKPEGIVDPLVSYSAHADSVLLEPFMGSGTALVVARRRGIKAIGIETREEYCEIAANRLRQGVLELSA